MSPWFIAEHSELIVALFQIVLGCAARPAADLTAAKEPCVTHHSQWPRREFLRATISLPAILFFAKAIPADAPAQTRPATPACTDNDDPTPPQTAGPFYKPSSPKRSS